MSERQQDRIAVQLKKDNSPKLTVQNLRGLGSHIINHICNQNVMKKIYDCFHQGIIFLIIWVPYATTSLTEAFGVKVVTTPGLVMKAGAAMWTKTCVCADPIIYFWFNTMVNFSFLHPRPAGPGKGKFLLHG